jgi:hypothetical protein
MSASFRDHENLANPLNGRMVTSSEAIQLLRSLQERDPLFCSFEANTGTLLVGVARDMGCVQFTPNAEGPPYLMATTGASENSDEYVEFLSGGTPSPVPLRYSLPWPLVERILTVFLDQGTVPSDITWEEI